MYLLDTNVISLTSPLAGSQHAEVRTWLREVADASYLSVISVAEIQSGATRLRTRGSHGKAEALAGWIEGVLRAFIERVLPVDVAIARRTGELLATAEAGGHEPGFEDACIAATAAVNRLVVVTNNVRHFRALGVAHQRPGA